LFFVPAFDFYRWSRYKVFMKTLTITDAKKNLGRWLAAAAQGEDIGIICGADIVALRKVNVESIDYAQREYGATPEHVAALEKATERRYQSLKRGKKLISVTPKQLRDLLE
jgi:antitoxin (DNA-binding transcriptional repressor) of toxin-antitoxin stability system